MGHAPQKMGRRCLTLLYAMALASCTLASLAAEPLAPLPLPLSGFIVSVSPNATALTAQARRLSTSGTCGQAWAYCIYPGSGGGSLYAPGSSQCSLAGAWQSVSSSWTGSQGDCTCVINCPQTNTWQLRCNPGYVGVGPGGFAGAGSCRVDKTGFLCTTQRQWNDNNGACYPCRSGAYCPGGTGLTYMYACNAGYFCPATTPSTPTFTFSTNPCPVGSYCPGQVAAPIPCPAGTFGASAMLSIAACSGQCAQGFYCLAGATTATQNRCPAGTYGNTPG
jgi:hypothetical protein